MKRIELVLLTFWLVILPLRSQTLNMRYDSGYNICHVNAIVSEAILEVFDEYVWRNGCPRKNQD